MDKIIARLSSNELGRSLVVLLRSGIDALIAFIALLMIFPVILVVQIKRLFSKKGAPKLLWGGLPIKSISYTSTALKSAGYTSITVVTDKYVTSSDKDFDINIHSLVPRSVLVGHIADTGSQVLFFINSLFSFDIYHYFFDGGLLRRTLLDRWELLFLRLAGKKVVLFPYGSDAFVYDQLSDLSWRHALLVNNAIHADRAHLIQNRIRRSSRLAHIIVGTIAHIDNLPRWDILPVVWYPFDMGSVTPIWPNTSGPIRISHAPNHRGAKGTEYLIEAVNSLIAQGIDIDLDLIEGVSNQEAITRMSNSDIILDQLLVGYALTAIEGLALGKIVISGMSDDFKYRVFRRNSYLNECPIVIASPESIGSILFELIQQREHWVELGKKSRRFAEKRHSMKASIAMWESIYSKIWWNQDVDLINYYSPHAQADEQKR